MVVAGSPSLRQSLVICGSVEKFLIFGLTTFVRSLGGGVLRERLEATRSMALPAASAELVYGPSTVVWSARVGHLPAVAVTGFQVATLVVVY